MRVALGAVEREPHPGGAGSADAVNHGVEAVFVRVGTAFFIEHRVAVEARGDEVVGRGAREEVARELLDAELVVREVGVQGFHDPVAVGPDLARAVFLEAVGVGITGEVEPAAGPALAIAGRSQQAVDELLVGVGRFVVYEGVGFLGRGRDSGEVEGDAAHEYVAIGFGRRLQSGLIEASADKRIDGMNATLREGCLLRNEEGPVVLIFSAFGDPSTEDGLVLGGHRLLRLRRRHDVVRVVGEDAVDDFALFGLTGDDGEFARLTFTMGRFREVEA